MLRVLGTALLVLSLGIKLNGSYGVPIERWDAAYRAVADELQRQGFAAEAVFGAQIRVIATRGPCSLELRLLDPHSTKLTWQSSALQGSGRLHYAWRGGWSERLPRAAPLIDYYLARELARQGLPAARQAVWLVGAGSGCTTLPDPGFSTLPVSLVRGG